MIIWYEKEEKMELLYIFHIVGRKTRKWADEKDVKLSPFHHRMTRRRRRAKRKPTIDPAVSGRYIMYNILGKRFFFFFFVSHLATTTTESCRPKKSKALTFRDVGSRCLPDGKWSPWAELRSCRVRRTTASGCTGDNLSGWDAAWYSPKPGRQQQQRTN